MDKKDNYVSVVTSINTWFGSKVRMMIWIFALTDNFYIHPNVSFFFSTYIKNFTSVYRKKEYS